MGAFGKSLVLSEGANAGWKTGDLSASEFLLLTGSQAWKGKAATLWKVFGTDLLKRGHQLLSRYSCKNCQTQLFMKTYFTGGSSEKNSSRYLQIHSTIYTIKYSPER